jgi:ribosomal protein S18 acetylase RimI-like enzyme
MLDEREPRIGGSATPRAWFSTWVEAMIRGVARRKQSQIFSGAATLSPMLVFDDMKANLKPLVTVRAATEEDKPALFEILVEAWFTSQAHLVPGGENRPSIEGWTRNHVEQHWKEMFLAIVEDGSVPKREVGMFQIQGNKIVAMNAHPAAKRRGVGSVLVEEAEKRIRDAGHREMQLDVLEGNTPAQAFYRAMGFEVARRYESTEFTSDPIPMLTMKKRLSDA